MVVPVDHKLFTTYGGGMTHTHPNAERLAQAIAERRAARHWSHARVSKHGGPTKRTQISYERGEIPAGVQSSTLDKIDLGLGWESGTALNILGGGAVPDPGLAEVVLMETAASAPVEQPTEIHPPAVGEDKVLQILERFQELKHELANLPTVTPGVKEKVEDMTAIQADILMEQVGPPAPSSKEPARGSVGWTPMPLAAR